MKLGARGSLCQHSASEGYAAAAAAAVAAAASAKERVAVAVAAESRTGCTESAAALEAGVDTAVAGVAELGKLYYAGNKSKL